VDESDASKTPRSKPEFREIWYEDVFVRADEHITYIARTVDKETDLSPNLYGPLGQSPGSLWRNDHIRRCSPAVEAFEHPDVCRPQAGYVTMNGWDGISLNISHWFNFTIELGVVESM
jgi:hypothetical protein